MKAAESSFIRGLKMGAGFFTALLTLTGFSILLAATVTGNVNSFSSGEVISAASINENFTSLKSAIEAQSLGSFQTVSRGVTYQATTDGFFHCSKDFGPNDLIVYTDSNPAPTTVRGRCGNATGSARCALTVPIRKNDYYLATLSAGNTEFCWFIPLGN